MINIGVITSVRRGEKTKIMKEGICESICALSFFEHVLVKFSFGNVSNYKTFSYIPFFFYMNLIFAFSLHSS